MLIVVTGVGFVLSVAALVSWLAARYLNWAMAPRRFGLRVAAAGALPVAMLMAVIVMVGISRGQGITSAVGALGRVPSGGKLLMLAMLGTGLGVSWLTAMRRNRREARRVNDAVEAFE
ncbi:MAG: hypothetical protein EAY70_04460 [Sphingomonadales bacterium]|nr:MAG: hypothetical protein EAY70_04460 [Sphingomonadales bacterium]